MYFVEEIKHDGTQKGTLVIPPLQYLQVKSSSTYWYV